MSKRYNISVEIGYELRTVSLLESEWKCVKSGDHLVKTTQDYYEGELFTYEFEFNGDAYEDATLVVTYDDGGTGFIGDIEDAIIDNH